MSRPEPEVFEVDPQRLQYGRYEHATGRDKDEGDIRGSYSADLIAMSGKVRKPFRWRGDLMVCVGSSGKGGVDQADAYRLVPVRAFRGEPTTYKDKTGTSEGAEQARNDPKGFYDGMSVTHGKEHYVLSGPPVRFVGAEEPVRPAATPAEPSQLSLF